MFCMSKASTTATIDSLGNDVDIDVLKWKDTLNPVIETFNEVKDDCSSL